MQQTMTIEQFEGARGAPVVDSDGDKIGAVEEIFYDTETGAPEWIGLGTGFFGTKRVLVPVAGAEMGADAFHVAYSKAQVKDAPDVDSDEISENLERDLYAYYGIPHSESRSGTVLPDAGAGTTGALDTGLPEGRLDSAGDTSNGPPVVTRSEEELRVGKRDVEAGRVRLRKWVETEPVAVDVDLQRETAHVTRERIDQPVSGAEIGEEQVDVPLRAEQAVAQKSAVAKERIGLEKDVEVEQQTVTDEVRKERVEVEGDVDR